MKVTLLGCGASAGVPLIGCECAVCRSTNPKNRRLRVSILLETAQSRVLVDTAPDLHEQALTHGFKTVDGVIYTHDHADHTHGIDELRSFNYHRQAPTDIYSNAATLDGLRARFPYAFKPPIPEFGWFRPALVPHEVHYNTLFSIGDIEFLPFKQVHGRVDTLGLRAGRFAYSTDVKELPEEAFEALKGVEVWVVDCLQREPAPTHAHLALALEWIARVKPRLAVLTHMSHTLDYESLARELPPGVVPGYDGMVLDC